jgi:hypothetical protein
MWVGRGRSYRGNPANTSDSEKTPVARRILIVAAACALAGGVAFWVLVVDPAQRHLDFCRSVHVELKSLTKKRPPDVSRQQWKCVVAWTLNGHANILTTFRNNPQAERDRFLAELRERLNGPVTLATIDWIWDQYEMLNPSYGPVYSGRYRPTSPERLREFETPGSSWCASWGLDVD